MPTFPSTLTPTVISNLAVGLELYYSFSNASVSGSLVADLATGTPVLDAKLENGAIVVNGELHLSSSHNQFMAIDAFPIGTTGLTFASWFRSSSSGSSARVFDFGNGQQSDNILMSLFENTNQLFVAVYYNGNTYKRLIWANSDVNNNQWYHAAWTLTPVGDWTLYVNGSVVAQASGMVYPADISRASNYLGQSNWNGDAYFNGAIRDFRMYNRLLTNTEISQLFLTTEVLFSYYFNFQNLNLFIEILGCSDNRTKCSAFCDADDIYSDFSEHS